MAVHRLTAKQVEKAQVKKGKKALKLPDGGGLRLDIDERNNKSWVFRFTSPVTKKERTMGSAAVPL